MTTYRCPTCPHRTRQHPLEGSTVYCLRTTQHPDRRMRIMRPDR